MTTGRPQLPLRMCLWTPVLPYTLGMGVHIPAGQKAALALSTCSLWGRSHGSPKSSSVTPPVLLEAAGLALTQRPKTMNLDQRDSDLRCLVVQESYGYCVHKHLPKGTDRSIHGQQEEGTRDLR